MAYLDRTGWTATADSEASLPTYAAQNAVDASSSNNWCSANTAFPHWLIVDFGAAKTFDVVTYFNDWISGRSPTSVEVYASDDGVTWGAAIGTATWPGPIPYWNMYHHVVVPRTTTRYIKFVGLAAVDSGNYMACVNLYIRIDQGLNRFGWTATTSSDYDATHTGQQALDYYDEAYMHTYWISGNSNGVDQLFPHWIAVDMQTSQTIDYVKYYPPGQPVPTLVRLYVSNLAAPDPTDLGDWTLAGEQYLPEDHRTHYIYSTDSAGNLDPQTCRHFMLVGVHDSRCGAGIGRYHRMACREIYAGLLAVGEDYKVYWHAHPKQFYIFPDNPLEGQLRSDAGIFDTLQFNPSVADPPDLQLGKAVCGGRLWHHAPLRVYYPEAMFWDWDVPQYFPDTSDPQPTDLLIETVSRMLEGTLVNASTLDAAFMWAMTVTPATICAGIFTLWPPDEHGIYGTGNSSSAAWDPGRFDTYWEVDGTNTESMDGFVNVAPYGHFKLWGSTRSTSPDHDVDVARLNATDIFYLIVWGATYAGGVTTSMNLSAELTFSGSLTVTKNGGGVVPPGPPTVCPDIPPGIIPPVPEPIPLECFHLITEHPQSGIYATLDFTDFLAAGDALYSASWTGDVGVIILAQSYTSTAASITANIPGAVDGEDYFIKCSVVTQLGITEVRRVQIEVRTANFGTHQGSGWWRL